MDAFNIDPNDVRMLQTRYYTNPNAFRDDQVRELMMLSAQAGMDFKPVSRPENTFGNVTGSFLNALAFGLPNIFGGEKWLQKKLGGGTAFSTQDQLIEGISDAVGSLVMPGAIVGKLQLGKKVAQALSSVGGKAAAKATGKGAEKVAAEVAEGATSKAKAALAKVADAVKKDSTFVKNMVGDGVNRSVLSTAVDQGLLGLLSGAASENMGALEGGFTGATFGGLGQFASKAGVMGKLGAVGIGAGIGAQMSEDTSGKPLGALIGALSAGVPAVAGSLKNAAKKAKYLDEKKFKFAVKDAYKVAGEVDNVKVRTINDTDLALKRAIAEKADPAEISRLQQKLDVLKAGGTAAMPTTSWGRGMRKLLDDADVELTWKDPVSGRTVVSKWDDQFTGASMQAQTEARQKLIEGLLSKGDYFEGAQLSSSQIKLLSNQTSNKAWAQNQITRDTAERLAKDTPLEYQNKVIKHLDLDEADKQFEYRSVGITREDAGFRRAEFLDSMKTGDQFDANKVVAFADQAMAQGQQPFQIRSFIRKNFGVDAEQAFVNHTRAKVENTGNALKKITEGIKGGKGRGLTQEAFIEEINEIAHKAPSTHADRAMTLAQDLIADGFTEIKAEEILDMIQMIRIGQGDLKMRNALASAAGGIRVAKRSMRNADKKYVLTWAEEGAPKAAPGAPPTNTTTGAPDPTGSPEAGAGAAEKVIRPEKGAAGTEEM